MRVKMSKPPPPAPIASAIGPCPTVIKIVGRPGTGSLTSTIAPPDHPPGLFGHFYSHLSFLFSFSLSLGDGLIQTEILSQRAVKPKTTNRPNLTTLFLGRLRPPKRLSSTSCTYFHQSLKTVLLEKAEGETKVCCQTGYRTQDP